MRSFLFAAGLLAMQAATAQTDTFYIHKFAQRIGAEVATRKDSAGFTRWSFDYHYVDRGSPVRLFAELLAYKGEPHAYQIKGGTSRFSTVDDSVVLFGDGFLKKTPAGNVTAHLSRQAYPLSGYAPATAQALLVQWWKKRGRPDKLRLLPAGEVSIRPAGKDAFVVNGASRSFDRYVISGIIWGNEILWLDEQGRVACLITNDAEGDKQEVLLRDYASLLPAFIRKAGEVGMQLFPKSEIPAGKRYPVTAITGGRIVDVVKGTVIENGLVVIQDKKIIYAGPTDASRIPKGAFEVDARGNTVLPGLWDMHAHFQQAEWGPAYLGAGVTSVRDCGNEFDYINAVKLAIDRGAAGPQIYRAGIIDGRGPYSLGVVQAATADEARAAVQRYHAAGYDQIKIYSSMTPAIVKATADEAHRLGLPVTGHIPDNMKLLQAIDSGFNMVNHIEYLWQEMKFTPEKRVDFSDTANLGIIRRLARQGIVYDATVGVYELAYRDLRKPVTDIEPRATTLPRPLQQIFENTGSDSARAARGARRVADYARLVREMVHAGVPVVAGSDMGFPGYSVLRELELYVSGGLTPMEALRTATIVPARVLKKENATGSIDAGKVADLLIVKGDPTQRISDIRTTAWVIREGTIYRPEALKKMAGFEIPK